MRWGASIIKNPIVGLSLIHIFEITTRITRVEEEPFKTEGKILLFAGWLEIYGREEQAADDQPALVPVQESESVKTEAVSYTHLAPSRA